MEREKIIKEMADIFRARRIELGLRRRYLADRIGCSDALIERIEVGKFSGATEKVKKLAEILGIDIDTHPACKRLCEVTPSQRSVPETDCQRQERPREWNAPAKRRYELNPSNLKIITRSVPLMRWGHEMPIDKLACILEVLERDLRRFEYGEVDAISAEAIQKLPGVFGCRSLSGLIQQAAAFERDYAERHGAAHFMKSEIARRLRDSAGLAMR